jgi:antibiotic biosynthesis monooxygenase (ABM) superfamily enzyme
VDESVTVTAVHTVAYGREADFFAWVNSLLLHAETSPNFLGGGLLGPPDAGGEWHVIYRWVDEESANWWEEVATRGGWMDRAESFAYPIQVQRITGLRTWFEKRAQPPSPPPKWKMALVTLTAVFPPVLLFNVAVIPYLLGFPVVLRTLALCIGVTVVVTWVMMPRLTRLLKCWLQPPPAQAAPPQPEPPVIASARRILDSARTMGTPRPPGRHAATGREQWLDDERPDEFDERKSWTPRSSATVGRPVLNLVPDRATTRSPIRRSPSRDPRSSYLRRETG